VPQTALVEIYVKCLHALCSGPCVVPVLSPDDEVKMITVSKVLRDPDPLLNRLQLSKSARIDMHMSDIAAACTF
jgi:hypothetical protein